MWAIAGEVIDFILVMIFQLLQSLSCCASLKMLSGRLIFNTCDFRISLLWETLLRTTFYALDSLVPVTKLELKTFIENCHESGSCSQVTKSHIGILWMLMSMKTSLKSSRPIISMEGERKVSQVVSLLLYSLLKIKKTESTMFHSANNKFMGRFMLRL